MEIISLDLQDKEMIRQWDDFCLYDSDAWFWHTIDWMRYTLIYRTDRQPQNHSFMIMDNGQIVGIIPLIAEKELGGELEFSYGAGPVPFMMFSKYIPGIVTRLAYETALMEIERIALKYNIYEGVFQNSALCNNFIPLLYMRDTAYDLIEAQTQLLTLDRPFPALLRQMRKGHIHSVKRGMETLNLHGVDQTSYSSEAFTQYENLHAKANGRVCRSHETFAFQKEWVDKGNGLLFSAFKDGAPRGCVYVFLYKNKAYFGSACNDPQYRYLPIGHAIQGAVIQRLCLHGYKQYELGLQYGDEDQVTDKERNISHFKHGFGGVTAPVYQWKKVYSGA